MTKIWLKLQLHFSQKTTTKTKLKSAVKINTALTLVEQNDSRLFVTAANYIRMNGCNGWMNLVYIFYVFMISDPCFFVCFILAFLS